MTNKTIEWVAIHTDENNEKGSTLLQANTLKEATALAKTIFDGFNYTIQKILEVGEIETVDYFKDIEYDEDLACLYFS
jgi:hypothetical protein